MCLWKLFKTSWYSIIEFRAKKLLKFSNSIKTETKTKIISNFFFHRSLFFRFVEHPTIATASFSVYSWPRRGSIFNSDFQKKNFRFSKFFDYPIKSSVVKNNWRGFLKRNEKKYSLSKVIDRMRFVWHKSGLQLNVFGLRKVFLTSFTNNYRFCSSHRPIQALRKSF